MQAPHRHPSRFTAVELSIVRREPDGARNDPGVVRRYGPFPWRDLSAALNSVAT